MTELDTIDIDYTILCDDVRREDNGKLIMIGVYGSSLLLASFPATLGMRIVTRLTPRKMGKTDVEFRISLGADAIAGMKGAIETVDMNPSITNTPPLLLHFAGPGQMKVEVREGGGKWAEILNIPVLQGDVLSQSN